MASARRKRPIAIDLFAGAGGFSLGFEQAGFDVVGAVEIDPIHAATHEFNFPRCKVMCRDAATLTGEEIRACLGLGFDDIDVVFGGAPCQGFSLMGKRGLDDPRNRLVNHFVRLVLELSPRYFVFENVYGLTVGKHRAFLEALMDEFEDEGYNVVHDYRVLDASAFGVPQKRRRLFMLGGKSGLTHPDYPEPITVPADEPILENFNGLKHGPSVWDAICDLPNVDEFPALLASDSVRVKLKKGSQYAQVLRGEVREANDFSYRRSHDALLLTSSLRTVHTNGSIVRFNRTGPGQVESISHYYRLDPNGVCNTLRAGTASDRGAFTSPRPIHPVHNRCITVREAARLHSYPDWFRFHITKWHGFRQIGNSVPPFLGRAVATSIREALGADVISPRHILALGPESLLTLGMGDAAEHSEVPSYVVAKRRRARDIKMTNENSTPPPAENIDIYVPIIRHIFQQHFKPKLKQFEFERKEIELAAKALKIVLPANKGDVVYSFRYRKNLPPEILQTAPRGFEWIIEGAGRSRYRFRLSRASRIVPRRNQHQIKIPNATPEIITAYATTDEQALLAKVRYNRLIDIFLGITTYSLQSHLRTQVKGIGQILIDEMYIGVSQSGAQYVIPVQAKGSSDMIGVVRARQDFLYCKERYPNLECRVVAVQAVEGDAIAMFELTLQDDDVRVRDERHYKLVPQDQISVKDLQEFRRAVSTR